MTRSGAVSGGRIAQYYGFGEDVLAVADGTVVYVHDGMPDETPSTPAHPLRGSLVQSASTTLRAECPVIRKSESRRAFSITRPSCGKGWREGYFPGRLFAAVVAGGCSTGRRASSRAAHEPGCADV